MEQLKSALVALWERISNEPVLVTTLIGAVIALLVAFGLNVTDDQKVAIIGVVAAVLALFARSKVTPV